MRNSPMAITALVLGIVGLCLFWFPFLGILIAVAAIVLGILGMKQCEKPEFTGKGMAVAGLVLGIIAAALFIVFTIVGLAFAEFFEQFAEDLENQIVLARMWLRL